MQNENLYRELINLAPDVFYCVDAETREIISLNPAFEVITGWQVEEWIKRPFPEILHPEDVPLAIVMFEEVLRGRTARPHLFRVRTRAGSYLTGEFHSAPLYQNGRITGVFGMARDVTERIRTAERQRFLAQVSAQLSSSLDYRSTVNALASSIVPFFADCCVVYRRESDESITRDAFACNDPVHSRVAERVHAEVALDPSSPHGVPQVIRTGNSIHYPCVTDVALEGETYEPERYREIVQGVPVHSWMCVPMSARDRVHGAIEFFGLTPGRQFDEDDLAVAEDIGYRAALAIDNIHLHRKTEAAVQEREAFLNTASHELKTPLTTVKGLTQRLQLLVEREEFERQRIATITRHLSTQVDRFERLIEDLIDVSRIREGSMVLRVRWVDIVSVARDVITQLDNSLPAASQHVLHLSAPAELFGRWDPDRLDQVLTNLLTNAIKYSPEGGKVRLSIRSEAHEAVISVQDEGIGIPNADQTHLFRPFGRSETVRRSIMGVGLGLYISREIVERHGGTISVKSETGSGSTFTVRLPLDGLPGTETEKPKLPINFDTSTR